MVNIFKVNANTFDYCQKFHSHFNVDEFQDINYSQYMFLKYLTAKSSSFFVVGNDNQSLYSWRGSNPAIMLNFVNKMKMPNVKTYYLTNSYRSSPKILNIANSLLTYNPDRLLKKSLKSCISDDISSVLCSIFETDDDMYEQVILDYQEFSKIKNTSTVILSRVNSLIGKTSRLIKLLDIIKIGYQVPKSQGLFGQTVILDVSAYLKFIYS